MSNSSALDENHFDLITKFQNPFF